MSDFFSADELLWTLISTTAWNGTLIMNIGPTADGRIPPIFLDRFARIGAWLGTNGEAIYGCSKSPFGAQPFGRTTWNEGRGRLYLHVYRWPEGGTLSLSGARVRPTSAALLARPSDPVQVTQTGDGLELRLTGAAPDPAVSVIAIEFEGSIEPLD